MALTQFLNQAQVNNQSAYNYYPVHSFGRLADRNNRIVRDDVIPFLAKQLADAVKAEDSHKTLVFIRALGNLGHPKILAAFEPYLEGQKPVSDFQRTAIVAAMDQLAVNYPRLARSVLYKIYQNAGECHQVRCAAVFALMRTTPPVAMLQRMAEMTHHDPSNQVSAAVKSAIESAAQLQSNDLSNLAANAKAAAKFLPQSSIAAAASAGSRSNLRDFVDRELQQEYAQQLSFLGSQDSDYPHGIFLAARRSFGGLNRASFANAMVSSIDVLADQLADQFDDSKLQRQPQVPRNAANKNERSKNQKQQQQNENLWSTQKIAQLLNIETEEAAQLEAQIFSNIMGSPRFFTFDNQSIQDLPEQVRQYAKQLRSGQTFNYTKLYNREAVTISFPLATGFPFVYSFKTPTLVQWGGEARMRTQPDMAEGPHQGGATQPEDDQLRIPKSANISAEMEMVYSTMTSAKVGFVTPFDHKRYSAGYSHKSQVFLPIRIEADIDLRNQEIVADIQPLIQSSWDAKQKQAVKIAHMSNWPYTSVQDILELRPIAESKDTKIVHVRQSQSVDQTFGDRATGMAFQLQGKYEKRFLDFATLARHISRNGGYSAAAMLAAPMATSFNEQYNFELSFDHQKSEVKKARVTLSYADDQEDDGAQPNNNRAARKSSSNNNAQDANPSSKSPNSAKRQQEFLQNAAAGIVHSEAAVVDLSIQFEGPAQQNHAEFVATWAVAYSPIDDKSRVLVYASSSPAKSQGKRQQLCVSAEAKFPSASQMNYRLAAEQNADSQIAIEVSAGDDCASSSATQITLKAKMQQSEQYKQQLRTHPVAKQCQQQMLQGNYQLAACQKAIRYANVLNQFKVTIDYDNLSSKAKNATEKLFNIARVAAFAHLDEDRWFSAEKKNRVQIEANFEEAGANVTIEAPSMRAQFTNLRLSEKFASIAAPTPDQSLVDRIQNALKKGTGE